MDLNAVDRMKINNAVERILHAPGSNTGGILEMAFVFDMNISRDDASNIAAGICGSLKAHSRVFQNVRLNAIRWYSDEKIVKEISAMPLLQMGRYFEDYDYSPKQKRLELLMGELKKFYARSKVVVFLTDEKYTVSDKQYLMESLQPFLYRRMIMIIRENKSGAEEDGHRLVIKSGMDLLKEELM